MTFLLVVNSYVSYLYFELTRGLVGYEIEENIPHVTEMFN